MCLLVMITVLAYVLHDLALLVDIGGGTFSSLVSSVFPNLVFAASTNEQDKNGITESKFALALMTIAGGIGATGVMLAVQKAQ